MNGIVVKTGNNAIGLTGCYFFGTLALEFPIIMELIDTHCHLYLDAFDADRQAVIQRAREEGVSHFFLPNIDKSSISGMLQLEDDYQGLIHSMMGLHPCSVKDDWEAELNIAEDWLGRRKFAGIGEVGLDFYWDRSFDREQVLAFQRQMDWALQLNLPLIIHSRDSLAECIRLVKEKQNGSLRGIFHCFSGSYASAMEVIDAGFFLGIGGVITYKNAGMKEVLEKLSLDYMVLETDAPYLTPVPFRGKRNESGYLKYIARQLAEIKGVPLDQVAEITTANAKKIFNA